MTTEQEFDWLLRSWFDSSAAPRQPDDLLESVLTTTAKRRPRPTWLVRLGGEPMPQSGRSGINQFAAIGLATALLVALLIGIATIGRSPNVGPSPVPNPSVAASPAQAPTPTPSPELPHFSELDSSQYQARLVSGTVGWVGTQTSLFRTSDAGQTWAEVQLPRTEAPASTSIVDAETVYVAFAGEPWTIASTHDGGASWQEASINGIPKDATLIFAIQSPTIGVATFFSEAEGTHTAYKTADGGASWSGPVVPKPPDVGDFLFKIIPGDRGVATYSNGKYDNVPFDNRLWLSTDGAQTWRELSFPTDDVSVVGELKQLSGTPWIDGSRMLIAVNVESHPFAPVDQFVGTRLYESRDNGASWRYINQLPNFQGSVAMLSPTEWVGWDINTERFWSTQDGGVNWRETQTDVDLYGWQGATFASVDRGWAVIRCDPFGPPAPRGFCDGTVKSVLIDTVDGGRTWQPIG